MAEERQRRFLDRQRRAESVREEGSPAPPESGERADPSDNQNPSEQKPPPASPFAREATPELDSSDDERHKVRALSGSLAPRSPSPEVRSPAVAEPWGRASLPGALGQRLLAASARAKLLHAPRGLRGRGSHNPRSPNRRHTCAAPPSRPGRYLTPAPLLGRRRRLHLPWPRSPACCTLGGPLPRATTRRPRPPRPCGAADGSRRPPARPPARRPPPAARRSRSHGLRGPRAPRPPSPPRTASPPPPFSSPAAAV